MQTSEMKKTKSKEKKASGSFSFENGKLDFNCHTENLEFREVLELITALRDECQRQIDNQTKCPFHKKP